MYERASELKSEQEDLQRATRKQRETGQLPPHRPRWFQPKAEADTGERYWAPIMQGEQLEYWFQREQVVKGMKSNAPVEWKDVDPIFVEADL
jgi:oxysterol-binding protein 1